MPEVAATRAVARQASGFGNVVVVERPANLGLSRSVISGVTEALAGSDRVIVLEDDLVTAPGFLDYMLDALALYADDPRVASAHAYLYPVTGPVPETFFVRGADCWGWGTWRRAWAGFEAGGQKLLDRLRDSGQLTDFNHGGRAPMFGQMLEDQINGRNDSWAIRWHASTWLADQLTLYPGRSLVQNIGFDSSGTHTGKSPVYDVSLAAGPIVVKPVAVEADAAMTARFGDFFATLCAPPRRKSWKDRLKRALGRR